MVCHLLAWAVASRKGPFPGINHSRLPLPSPRPHQIGILPSLEILPFFEETFQAASRICLAARSSYGSIARDMLTGALDGGVLPWEIFASDVLARPGQRTEWGIPLFAHACPTELVLRAPVHRALYPPKDAVARKLPVRMVIGVESRNSLTKKQLHEWLADPGRIPKPEIVFRFLPMELMLQAMAAEAIDGFIAPSPWGLIAAEKQLGILDACFKPGKFGQQLVVVCRKGQPIAGLPAPGDLAAQLANARSHLSNTDRFENAAARMAESGKPVIHAAALANAARLHASSASARDVVPDVKQLTGELRRLESFAVLPPQIAPTEPTAMLLLSP